jgi:hypothetical protein
MFILYQKMIGVGVWDPLTHHMSEPYLGLDNDYVIDHVTL